MKTFWEKEAAGILKGLMKRHEISYKRLSLLLEAIGEEHSERQLINRINVGKFPLTLYLQSLHVLGYREEHLRLTRYSSSDAKPPTKP